MTKAATGFWRCIADFFARLFRWPGSPKPAVPDGNENQVAEPPAPESPPDEPPENGEPPEKKEPESPSTGPILEEPTAEEIPVPEPPAPVSLNPPPEAITPSAQDLPVEPTPPQPDCPDPIIEPCAPDSTMEPDSPDPSPKPEPVPTASWPTGPKAGLQVVSGLGVWIWVLKQAEYGSITRISERARRAGLSWLTIKGGDGVNRWGQFTPEVVARLQEAGLKVLGWVYVYGRDSLGEAEVAKSILETGCDGLIIDAEAEYEGNPRAAEAYMRAIRSAYPNAFVAYSSYPLISKHRTFPYAEFGRYCDASMPQCYWKLIGISPEEMMRKTDEEWGAWAEAMQAGGFEASVVPLIPAGQGFNVIPDDVVRFLELSSKYAGVSLWSWNHMTGDLWEALAGLPDRGRRDPEPEGE